MQEAETVTDLKHLIEDFDKDEHPDKRELWKEQRIERSVLRILYSGKSPRRHTEIVKLLNTVT